MQETVRVSALKEAGHPLCLRIEGEMDLSNTQLVRSQIDELLGDESDVILDLGPVTFMDSTALGMLVHLAKRVEERGGKLTLVITHAPIHKLFSITALDRHFTICGTREEALKRF